MEPEGARSISPTRVLMKASSNENFQVFRMLSFQQ
jgi:hypothetical protein